MKPIEWMQISEGLVTSLVAIIGLTVAWRGLNTWRDQLLGSADHALAKALLLATYKLREAIRGVRAPFISIGELEEAYKQAGKEIPDSHSGPEMPNTAIAYDLRWGRVREMYAGFDAQVLEAETLWNGAVRDHAVEIVHCMRDLQVSLGLLLSRQQLGVEEYKAARAIVYEVGEADDFSKRLQAAIRKIEDEARPRLRPR